EVLRRPVEFTQASSIVMEDRQEMAFGYPCFRSVSAYRCGHSMGERALTGGAMGAGAGALVGAASGGNTGIGAPHRRRRGRELARLCQHRVPSFASGVCYRRIVAKGRAQPR